MRSALLRALLVLTGFALAGPLVGLVTFSIGIGLLAVLGGRPDGLWLTPFFLLYGSIFAHYAGIVSALVAGIAALALAATNPLQRRWIGPASGILSYAVAASTGSVWLPPDTQATSFGDVADQLALGFATVMLAVHVLSASACWWLTQGLTLGFDGALGRRRNGH